METTTCINIICNGNKDVNTSFKNTVGKRFSALKKKYFLPKVLTHKVTRDCRRNMSTESEEGFEFSHDRKWSESLFRSCHK